MKKINVVVLVSVGILVVSGQVNAAGIKEGKWSMTTTIHMPGMDAEAAQAMKEMEKMSPEEKAMMAKMMGGMNMHVSAGGQGMVTTTTQCITNDNPVPEASSEENCQQTHSVKGNTVDFKVVCKDSQSTGKVTYKNDSMKGAIKSVAKGQEVNIDIAGEYVGPCDKNASDVSSVLPAGMSEKELTLKQKELELKEKELELKAKEMQLKNANEEEEASAPKGASALDTANNAVNTGNKVKNTLGGLRSLMGR